MSQPTAAQLAEYDAAMQQDITDEEDARYDYALIEQQIERDASLAFNFPVSHGPHADSLSAQWDHEDAMHEGRSI
jgi:hypothetical protein